MARVRIVKKPTAKTGLEVRMQAGLYGTNGNRQFSLPTQIDSQKYSEPDTEVRNTLQSVPRNMANLEAEKGETAVVNIDGFPAHFNIGGKRHSQGGTPLNLPDDSFIFSDTAKMKIKDPEILKQFGMSLKSGGYTPADIAKKYQINKFRKMLADPETDDLQRSTAEMMIANYNEKLAKLALAQESKKGFPQGMPAIAQPYLQAHNIDPAQYIPTQGQEADPNADMGVARYGANVVASWQKAYGGVQYRDGLPMGQHGFDPTTLKGWGAGLLNVLEAPQRAMMYVGTGLFGDKARYEMPSETLKRNYPESSPYLQGALDIVADPFLVTGALKSGARLATKAITEAATEHAIKGTLKNASKYEATRAILTTAGKPVTAKNVAIATKASTAAEKAAAAGKSASKIESATAKAAATERMAQDVKKVGELTGKVGQKVIEKTAQASKYVGEKAKKAIDAMDLTSIGPVTKPLVRTTTSKILNAGYKDENEKLKEEVAKLKQETQNRFVPAGTDPSGAGLFTNTADPSQKYIYAGGKYIPYTKEVADTLGMYKFNAPKEHGGNMGYYNGGGAVVAGGPKEKFTTYEDGSMYNNITKTWVKNADPSWKPKAEAKKEATPAQGKAQGDIKIQKNKPAGLPAGPNAKATVRPYGEDPEVQDFLKTYLTPGAADLYSKEIGYQKKDPKTGHYGVEDITEEDWRKSNKQFLQEHPDFDPKNKKHLGMYEDWYNQNTKDKAYRKALYDAKKKGLSEDEAKKHAEAFSQRVVDQIGFINKPGDVRHKDLMWGKYHRSRKELEFQPDPEQPTPPPQVTIKPGEKQPDAVKEPFVSPGLKPVKGKMNAPWWLQDIIGTAGAFGDLARVKKYEPWQATPQAFLPQATFYDPTRELAANAEQANIASQFHQAFTGPKTGQMAGVQGQAMKNAADIMSRYNNMNVGVANQLEQERAQIMNQASQNRAGLATQLWDKYAIANQQFDNAKNQAREQLRKHVISAVTNRAKTQALNELYPNYYTDPSTGGMLGFHPDFTKLPADKPDLKNPYWEAFQLTGSPENALRYLELQNKGAMGNPYDERRAYMGAQGYGE